MWIPAVAALAGAFIGSIAPVVTSLIKARDEKTRDMVRLAYQAAIADHAAAIDVAHRSERDHAIPPLVGYLVHHTAIARLVMNGLELTPERLKAVSDKYDAAEAVFKDRP